MERLGTSEEATMKAPILAAIFAAVGMTALAQPASACPNGYEPVWIQGNKVCKIKTPKLDLKADTGRELKKNSTFKANTAKPAAKKKTQP
jgi:hypothetical protein